MLAKAVTCTETVTWKYDWVASHQVSGCFGRPRCACAPARDLHLRGDVRVRAKAEI